MILEAEEGEGTYSVVSSMNASQLDDIAAASRASPRAQSPEKRTADTIKSPEHKPDINSQAELKGWFPLLTADVVNTRI